MASKKTAFAVGLFVIIGLAIAIIAIVWLGMSNYFDKGRYYVAFFDESVQGLDKDSPVKYRGVSIGRVHSIRVAKDATLIEVVLSIEQDIRLESDMYAQLKSVGITGIMFIEIDRKKAGEPDYLPPISFYTEYPIIQTKPSGMKLFMDVMDEITSIVSKLDTKGISDKLKSSVDIISQFLEEAQIKALVSDTRSLLAKTDKILDVEKWHGMIDSLENTMTSLNTLATDANQIVTNTNKAVNVLSANTNQTVKNLNKAITTLSTNANQTVANINKTISGIDGIVRDNENEIGEFIGSLNNSVKNADDLMKQGVGLISNLEIRLASLQRDLQVTLQHLEKTSEHLNKFADAIADQPSQLLFGEPVPSKEADR